MKRTDRGALRSTENATDACAIVAEHDAQTISPESARDTLASYGIAATIYTTPSHEEAAQRWRVVCPTSRAIGKDEYGPMVARLNGLFAGALSRESFTVAQSFYFGRVNGHAFASYTTKGEPLDTLDELDAHARWPDGTYGRDSGPTDATTDEKHRNTIRTGSEGVHAALRGLAARFAGRGMARHDIVATLYSMMDAAVWRNSERWRERRAAIPRLVATACEKFSDPREPAVRA